MNNLDFQYQNLLQYILDQGETKQTRNGKTLSTFGYQIIHDMKEGFPLLTTKKMAMNSIMTELKWFLKGRTDLRYLLENNCNIWNGDAFKAYLDATSTFRKSYQNEYKLPNTMEEFIQRIKGDDEFNNQWGSLGSTYGKQWRRWDTTTIDYPGKLYDRTTIDQLSNLIKELKTNPDSRRLLVSAWNVSELHEMILPPCHYGFQLYTRELTFAERYELYTQGSTSWEEDGGNSYGKITGLDLMDEAEVPTRGISLMWNQRSVDTFLGLPFNIASYGMLLVLISKTVNMVPEDLIGNLGDTHLYENHIEQAREQLSRKPFHLPSIEVENVDLLSGEFDYKVLNYSSHPGIKAPLSN